MSRGSQGCSASACIDVIGRVWHPANDCDSVNNGGVSTELPWRETHGISVQGDLLARCHRIAASAVALCSPHFSASLSVLCARHFVRPCLTTLSNSHTVPSTPHKCNTRHKPTSCPHRSDESVGSFEVVAVLGLGHAVHGVNLSKMK